MKKSINFFIFLIYFFYNLNSLNCLCNDINSDICEQDNIINLPIGSLRGGFGKTTWTRQIYREYLNIPFAKPPIGNLRFQAPVAHDGWVDIRDATTYGNRCPVSDLIRKLPLHEQIDENLEDCLTLNVFTKEVNTRRPVMVYIHGGALVNGTAAEHRPDYLIEKDIVFVTVQYRLAGLGFLSTKTRDIPGNMGAMDIILALEWIQKYIKYFGGDAHRVTIFGESAGATLTSLLMVSPKVRKNLFSRAIMQSGTSLLGVINQRKPIAKARKTCELIGCNKCDEIDNINKCLIKAPLITLLEAGEKLGIVPYGFVENDFYGIMNKNPKDSVQLSLNRYQFMAGVVKHEGGFLTAAGGPSNNPREFLNTMIESFDENDEFATLSSMIENLYFKDGELDTEVLENLVPQMVDIAGTIVFKSPLKQFLELYLTENYNQNYLYSFDYVGATYYKPYLEQFVEAMKARFNARYPFTGGVEHASDLMYLYPAEKLNKPDTRMAKMMVELWTSFAINGKPEANNQIEIPVLQCSRGPYFHINQQITVSNNFIEEYLAGTNEVIFNAIRNKG